MSDENKTSLPPDDSRPEAEGADNTRHVTVHRTARRTIHRTSEEALLKEKEEAAAENAILSELAGNSETNVAENSESSENANESGESGESGDSDYGDENAYDEESEATEPRLSFAPFLRGGKGILKLGFDRILALLPLCVWAFWMYGERALLLILTSVASCAAFELLCRLIFSRTETPADVFCIYYGIVNALLMPVSAPTWLCIVSAFISVVIVRYVVGILLKSPRLLNPCLTAYLAVSLLFSDKMKVFATGWTSVSNGYTSADYTQPFSKIMSGILPDEAVADLLIGNYFGLIGTVSTVLIAAAFLYLVVSGTVSARIPVAYLATFAALCYLIPAGSVPRLSGMEYSLATGTVAFIAVFMATDMPASPATPDGRIVFGALCGAFTFAFSRYISFIDGAALALFAMAPLSGIIDRLFMPVPFGHKRKKAA